MISVLYLLDRNMRVKARASERYLGFHQSLLGILRMQNLTALLVWEIYYTVYEREAH